MFRVIDIIRFDETLILEQPDIVERFGLGILAILDPAQVTAAPMQAGSPVRIHRLHGKSIDRVVSKVDVRYSGVGLFFKGVDQHEIPRQSEIELLSD